MGTNPTWLDEQLNKAIANAGTPLPTRTTLNFVSGATITDNPGSDSTDVTVLGGGAAAGQNDIVLVNGANNDIPLGGKAVTRITGPTAAFSITGVSWGSTPTNGQRVTLINTVAHPLTLTNEDSGSTATNRIQTLRGNSISTVLAGGCVDIQWDKTASRWVIITIGVVRPATVDVRDFGAMGNGVANDSAALNSALATGGSVSAVSPGTSNFAVVTQLNAAGQSFILRGAGRDRTTVTAQTATMTILAGASGYNTVILEDLTLDCSTEGLLGALFDGAFFSEVICRRVGFTSSRESNLVHLQYASAFVFEDCVFEGNGLALANACVLSNNVSRVILSRCVMRGLFSGLDGASTSGATPPAPNTSEITVEDCDIDAMYYTLPSLVSGSGGTVTYTQSDGISTHATLVDTSKSFTVQANFTPGAAPTQFGYIRVMPTRASGTITTAGAARLIDSGASFLSDGIIAGEIVRAGTSYGIVVSVESDTQLNLEAWLDQTTTLPVAPPVSTTAYKVLGIILNNVGTAPGAAGTTLTMQGTLQWSDLNGAAVTPANGTLYEIMATPSYPIFLSAACRQGRFLRNTIRRSYTDAISPFGDQCTIAHNTILDCQDVGITVDGSAIGQGAHLVHDNLIVRQGRFGIFVGQDKTDVHDNQIIGWGARFTGGVSGTTNVSAIGVESALGIADNVHIHDNVIDANSIPVATVGIGLANTTAARIYDNKIIGCVTDIQIEGSSTDTMQVRHDSDRVTHVDADGLGVPPGQTLEIVSSTLATPDNVIAGPGSLWRSKSNGGIWIKSAGSSGPGWQPLTPFVPTMIPGCIAWFRSDLDVIASTTFTLPDQSGNGFDMTATGSARPTLGSGVGGFQKVIFDGVANNLLSPGTTTQAQPLEYFIICAFNGVYASNDYLVDWSNTNAHGNAMSFARTSGTTVYMYSGTALQTTTTPNNLHVYNCRFNGASSELDIDGVSSATGAVGATTGFGLCLGAAFGGTVAFAPADFYELVAYNRLLTGNERARVNDYLLSRYGT